MKERKCRKCHKYFVIPDTLGSVEKIIQYCDSCLNLRCAPKESYKKDTLYKLYEKVQIRKGVTPSIEHFRQNYERAYEIYDTEEDKIILRYDDVFPSHHGTFKLLDFEVNYGFLHRRVQCMQCNKITKHTLRYVFMLYTGLLIKKCRKCNPVYSYHKRNTSGLIKGSNARPDSFRNKAKEWNVSLSDLQRKKVDGPVPPLDIGTIVKDFKIVNAYWDKSSCSPKYEVECLKCRQRLVTLQKKIQKLRHICK